MGKNFLTILKTNFAHMVNTMSVAQLLDTRQKLLENIDQSDQEGYTFALGCIGVLDERLRELEELEEKLNRVN